MRASWRAMAAILVAGILMGLAGMIAGPASAAPGAPAASARAAVPAATSYSAAGALSEVAAAANNNAWAVGYSGSTVSPKILMLHWNGSAWSKVAAKQLKLNGSAGQLSAITVVNAKDAYAVGYTGSPLGTTRTLLLHWNGSTWGTVTSPTPVARGALTAVTVTAKGGWAVGYYATGPAAVDYWTLAFRLSGAKWSRVSSKTDNAAFTGVAVTSAGITWATANAVGMITGGVAEWKGSAWSWLHSFPVQGQYHALNAIAAGPRGIAFAVGANGNVPETPALSMEWNGHAWVKAAVSAPLASSLDAVTFAPGGAAWAAGSTELGGADPMIVHWNGHEWTRVAAPGKNARLDGIGFSAAKYGWAVGSTGLASGSTKTLILHWNGGSWK